MFPAQPVRARLAPPPLPVLRSARPDLPVCLGPAAILRRVWQDDDLAELTQALVLGAEARAPGAAMDLASLLLTQGEPLAGEGLVMQNAVLDLARSYVIRPGADFTVLALVCPGGFMANTPIDFLLADRKVTLILHYLTADQVDLSDLPPHDVMVLAIAESPENRALLDLLHPALARHPGPVMNRDARAIARLTREDVASALQGIPGLVVPRVQRLTREDLLCQGVRQPVLLRPLGSHAGQGLALVDSDNQAADWLAETGARELTLTPFVDYRGADGMYAKYRIALINGQPMASHMAISRHWMVHYLNAEMTEHADRRAREAAWMADFDTFASRHATVFQAVTDRLGLGYLGLDCAELPDGRLVLFEADVAMIVHDLDDPGLFPYKKPAMRRLFATFEAALRQEARRTGPWPA